MIDVFAALARPVKSPCPPGYKMDPRRDKCVPVHQKLGDAPPAPAPTNWTGIPEPPGWKELTGGMSWPPTGAFPPSPPPACAYAPGLWPCSPWPPPPPPLWPQGWPWPLPLGPAPGAPPPPPPAAVTPPQVPAAPEKPFPWGWVVLGGLALGAGLLVMSGAGALALAENPGLANKARRLHDDLEYEQAARMLDAYREVDAVEAGIVAAELGYVFDYSRGKYRLSDHGEDF